MTKVSQNSSNYETVSRYICKLKKQDEEKDI